jgi:hypothetical protein
MADGGKERKAAPKAEIELMVGHVGDPKVIGHGDVTGQVGVVLDVKQA